MSISIRAKLATIVCLLMLPIGVLAWLFIQQSFKDIDFADKERDGVTYLGGAWPVLRGLIEGGGSASAPRDLGRGGEVAALGRTYGAAMDTAEPAAALADALKALDWPNRPLARDAKLEAAIAAARALVTRVADGSNLTLDPDLDSYYVMDVVTTKLPEAIDRLGTVLALARSGQRAAQLSDDDKAAIVVQLGQLESAASGAAVLDGLRLQGERRGARPPRPADEGVCRRRRRLHGGGEIGLGRPARRPRARRAQPRQARRARARRAARDRRRLAGRGDRARPPAGGAQRRLPLAAVVDAGHRRRRDGAGAAGRVARGALDPAQHQRARPPHPRARQLRHRGRAAGGEGTRRDRPDRARGRLLPRRHREQAQRREQRPDRDGGARRRRAQDRDGGPRRRVRADRRRDRPPRDRHRPRDGRLGGRHDPHGRVDADACRPRWRRPPSSRPPTSSRSPPRPRSSPPRSARSTASSGSRATSRPTRSRRPRPPTSGSASCRSPARGSATSST